MSMDSAMHWVRKKKFYTIGDLLNGMTTPATGTLAAGEGIQSAAGTVGDSPEVSLAELSTFGISGLQFTATIADKLAFILRLPYDLDPKFPVGMRINHSASAAAGAGVGITWVPTYKIIKKSAAVVTIASVTTALNTTIALKLNSIANGNEWSSRGIINSLGLTREELEDGAIMQLALDCTYGTTPGTVTLFGVEIDYAKYTCEGPGSLVDQPLRANSLAAL